MHVLTRYSFCAVLVGDNKRAYQHLETYDTRARAMDESHRYCESLPWDSLPAVVTIQRVLVNARNGAEITR